jgi:hypothetical protein
MRSSLKLSTDDKRKLHTLCINKKYNSYREDNDILYNFDFIQGIIIPVGYYNLKFKNKILKLYRHFENILNKYINIFKNNPSKKVYYELAHKYNMSINYINQHFNPKFIIWQIRLEQTARRNSLVMLSSISIKRLNF